MRSSRADEGLELERLVPIRVVVCRIVLLGDLSASREDRSAASGRVGAHRPAACGGTVADEAEARETGLGEGRRERELLLQEPREYGPSAPLFETRPSHFGLEQCLPS